MRLGCKYLLLIVLVAGMLFINSTGQSISAVESVKEYTLDAWPHRIYYLAVLSGPNAPYDDITVHITAMNNYTLYVNGELIGSDNDWRTVEAWPVNVGGSNDIVLAVKVDNSGMSGGNGLMVDIDAGTDWIGTTTLKRRSAVISGTRRLIPVLWWYYTGDITELMGDEWYTLNYNPSTGISALDSSIITDEMGQVIKGNIDEAQLDYHHDANIEIVAGYIGNIDFGGVEDGGIQLRSIEGENLALKKSCKIFQLVDGDPTNSFWGVTGDPLGVVEYVDLEDVYRVSRFVMYTGGTNYDLWTQTSVCGFDVDISHDMFSWDEVASVHDVGITNALTGGHNYAIVDFPDVLARYIRFRITEERPDPPTIGEIMVYGEGYTYNGEYESEWLGFGSEAIPKTFDRVDWTYDEEAGTKVILQTKTAIKDYDATIIKESDWSDEYPAGQSKFLSPEPATVMKYRVKLSTTDIYQTPAITSLSFSYSDVDQPLISADGYITPNEVFMERDTTFVCTLSYELLPGEDIKYLAFNVPSPATLNYLVCTDPYYTDTLFVDNGVSIPPGADTLYVELYTPITDSDAQGPDSLYVSFNTKLLSNYYSFNAFMYNSALNDGAGGVKVWENIDLGSWTVLATDYVQGFHIQESKPLTFYVSNPYPNPFNPHTTIQYMIPETCSVELVIYDILGRKMKVLQDGIAPAGKHQVVWDGTDDNGKSVAGGLYLYRVKAGSNIYNGKIMFIK